MMRSRTCVQAEIQRCRRAATSTATRRRTHGNYTVRPPATASRVLWHWYCYRVSKSRCCSMARNEISHLIGQTLVSFRWKQSIVHLLFESWATLIERSLIWSALGLMSKQGLFPMPMLDISARRTSVVRKGILVMYRPAGKHGCRKLYFKTRHTSVSQRLLP